MCYTTSRAARDGNCLNKMLGKLPDLPFYDAFIWLQGMSHFITSVNAVVPHNSLLLLYDVGRQKGWGTCALKIVRYIQVSKNVHVSLTGYWK